MSVDWHSIESVIKYAPFENLFIICCALVLVAYLLREAIIYKFFRIRKKDVSMGGKDPSKLTEYRKFVNKKFRYETIELDGSSYENCDFYHCIIKYKASESFTLVNCNFEGVKWVLEGPAELTMRFLAATYTGMGEGGKQLIDDTFQNIKNGKY